jgi:hypothetical protein
MATIPLPAWRWSNADNAANRVMQREGATTADPIVDALFVVTKTTRARTASFDALSEKMVLTLQPTS